MVNKILKKFSAIYGTRRFITVITRSHHWPLSSVIFIQSAPSHRIFLICILILSSQLPHCFPSALLPGFPTKILYALVISILRAICPAHLILLHSVTIIIFGEVYNSCNLSLCNLHQSPATSSTFGPNLLLSYLFPSTLDLFSSLSMRYQIPHPYKTTGKIMVFNILIFKLSGRRRVDETL